MLSAYLAYLLRFCHRTQSVEPQPGETTAGSLHSYKGGLSSYFEAALFFFSFVIGRGSGVGGIHHLNILYRVAPVMEKEKPRVKLLTIDPLKKIAPLRVLGKLIPPTTIKQVMIL